MESKTVPTTYDQEMESRFLEKIKLRIKVSSQWKCLKLYASLNLILIDFYK